MKENNPITKDPSKNWTARSVEVIFDDGTSKQFSYGKLASNTLGISYSTWKWALRNNQGKIPKYGIAKIIQGTPKETNKKQT